jgi:hypothetical protein
VWADRSHGNYTVCRNMLQTIPSRFERLRDSGKCGTATAKAASLWRVLCRGKRGDPQRFCPLGAVAKECVSRRGSCRTLAAESAMSLRDRARKEPNTPSQRHVSTRRMDYRPRSLLMRLMISLAVALAAASGVQRPSRAKVKISAPLGSKTFVTAALGAAGP